jgi:hypothetical protein
MPLRVMHVIPPAVWAVGKDDPDCVRLSALPDWGLVNPQLYHPDFQPPEVWPSESGDPVYVTNNLIYFRTPEISRGNEIVEAQSFFTWLRYHSGQPSLVRDIVVTLVPSDEQLHRSPAMTIKGKFLVAPHFRASAVRFTSVGDAPESGSYDVPVYSELLLDAALAYEDRDFHKSILYSAIATEVMASKLVDCAFSAAQSKNDPRWCWVRAAGPHESDPPSDPIYDRLRKAARRDFRTLLHELPMYALRRSLLLEDKRLYDALVTLHDTRNDLVHLGESGGRPKLEVSRDGARRALTHAEAAFRWFGASGRYSWKEPA